MYTMFILDWTTRQKIECLERVKFQRTEKFTEIFIRKAMLGCGNTYRYLWTIWKGFYSRYVSPCIHFSFNGDFMEKPLSVYRECPTTFCCVFHIYVEWGKWVYYAAIPGAMIWACYIVCVRAYNVLCMFFHSI